MKSRIILAAVVAFSLFFGSHTALAQFHKGDGDFTLSGTGHSDKSLSNTDVGATASLGYMLTSDFEIGLRQDLNVGSSVSGATSAFADYNFTFGKIVPFIGVNAGYAYGGGIPNFWSAGPEAGVRYFLNTTTYIYAKAAYDFDLNKGVNSGDFQYTAGLGLRF